jgi:hypothetical protein
MELYNEFNRKRYMITLEEYKILFYSNDTLGLIYEYYSSQYDSAIHNRKIQFEEVFMAAQMGMLDIEYLTGFINNELCKQHSLTIIMTKEGLYKLASV